MDLALDRVRFEREDFADIYIPRHKWSDSCSCFYLETETLSSNNNFLTGTMPEQLSLLTALGELSFGCSYDFRPLTTQNTNFAHDREPSITE
jgi:hypothetical protein